jgi:hypothetical protein
MSKASDATKGQAPSEDGFAAERRPTLSRPAGWRNPAIKVLCRSARYTISKEYELAFVEGEGWDRSPHLASFYGDPLDAAISPDEQWCVVVGRGPLVAHRLKSPWWDPMATSDEQPRAWSPGYDTRDCMWFSHVRAAIGHRFIVTAIPAPDGKVQEFIVDADTHAVDFHREWASEDLRYRSVLMESFVGLPLVAVSNDGDQVRLRFGTPVNHQMTLTDEIAIHAAPHFPRTVIQARDLQPGSPIFAALENQIGCTIVETHAGDDGAMSLQLSPIPPVTVGPPFSLHVQAGRPCGAWQASGPKGDLMSPGVAGWVPGSQRFNGL